MILNKEQLENFLGGYNDEDANTFGITLSDQIAIEQLKMLKSIKSGVNSLVVITGMGIAAYLLNACGLIK
jgi:hypothetical protein